LKKNIYFLFNFYGAGNIGDDLMLAGYLVLFGDKYNIDAFTPYNVASQRLRFPEINWLKKRPANFKTYDKIIGMGDTPFQITAGAWLIRYINKHIKKIKLEGRCFEMQFVGAEKEVINANWFHRRKIKNIINSTSKILTRDSHSKNIIESFEAKSDIVNAGDIANAYLSRYGTNQDKNELKSIAINYFTYKSDRRIISLLQRFIKNHPDIKFTFFANETRKSPPFEKYTFTKYFSIYENVSFIISKSKNTSL
jgi:polysaccharide pyruvyl transferase WcaK-like protein